MTQAQSTLSASRNVSELVAHIDKLTQEIQQLYCLDDVPWVVGYSGGERFYRSITTYLECANTVTRGEAN